jgi:hypothetical protein
MYNEWVGIVHYCLNSEAFCFLLMGFLTPPRCGTQYLLLLLLLLSDWACYMERLVAVV